MTHEVAFSYSGQTVLVTGGATGLGFAIAEVFGRAGAQIALNDLSPDRAAAACDSLQREGIFALSVPADVRNGAAVQVMIETVVTNLGAPHVVAANAGIYPNTPLMALGEEEWDRVLDTNLKGVFLTCQMAARAMVAARRQGQIVTISSGAANVGFWGWSHYCASKAGVVGLTRAMAVELGEHGIRVNAILPGYVEVIEGGAHLTEEYKSTARAANLRGRPGEPSDVARAVVLLCSPLADFVTGATLTVDGGGSAGRFGIRPSDG